MKGKGNRIRKVISILCMILVITLATPCVAEAAPATWSNEWDNEDYNYKWYCVGKKGYFYCKNSTVYQHVNGKSKKIASWNSDKGDVGIAYGRGDWLYVHQANVLYGYNLKTRTKKIVMRNCYPVGWNASGCGPYFYSREETSGDIFGAAYVWKLSGGTAKKLGTLGKHVKFVHVVGKEIVVEDFPQNGSLRKMAIYRYNPNGTGKKQDALMEVAKGHIYSEGYTETSIEIYADDFVKKTSTHYSYDLKTGKLNVVKVNYF